MDMPGPLTPEEAKLLLALCRAGKLYEIERWITSGKSLQTPSGFKKSPLSIAVEMGFHSLVELLARNESSQEIKNKALSDAISTKRLDLVELLIAHGAQVRSVPFAGVLCKWDPAMMRFFLENDADVITGHPFAVAFGEKIRTSLRPFVEYKKAHPEIASELQEQADRALRYFSREGDLKWVSLMLWAGANPRTRGPLLDDRIEDDPECYTTALREACYKGSFEVLIKLKPDASGDDMSDLLHCAALPASDELIRYLLKMGAKPNDKANGGSSALDRCLWNLGFKDFDAIINKRPASRYALHGTFDCIQTLVERGALWRPDSRAELNSLRQILFKCEPEVTVEVVKLLARFKACPEETLDHFLDTPRMRSHLSKLGMKLYAGHVDKDVKPRSHRGT